jgi:hypothetical protein
MWRVFGAVTASLVALIAAPHARSSSQQAAFRSISSSEVFEAVYLMTKYASSGFPSPDKVVGDRVFEGMVLAADTLTFMPKSRLIFTGSIGDQTRRYLLVRTLIVEGEGATPAAVITWDRDSGMQRITAPVGKASPGSIGPGEGADGVPGPDGVMGNPGYPGRIAPTIFLIAHSIKGGPIAIDLRGQDGGGGGVGQIGGDGGFGRAGRPAAASFGICQAAGFPGGNGGLGGKGGTGGEGGRGGNGGAFVFLGPAKDVEVMAKAFFVDIRSGKGGEGGPGGEPGRGGEGGPPGRFDPPCPQPSAGKRGPDGIFGDPGPQGPEGQPGVFFTTGLNAEQVASLQLRPVTRK